MRYMKNMMILLLAALALSCSFLDFDETSGLKSKEDMYKYYNSVEQMLTNVYSYMLNNLTTETMRDCGSDDAEHGNTASVYQYFNNGVWSSVNTVDDSWSLYHGIRAANSFIAEVQNVDLSRYQHDAAYDNWMKKLAFFPYEARVLRAYYFFELARRYGDIAMPLTVLDASQANTISKTPFAKVVDFIVEECDACAPNLPQTYQGQPGNQIGRMTSGFAKALKSKALLYAASPLHNPSGDVEIWKESASAALDIIDDGYYSLDPEDCANRIDSPEVVMLVIGGDSRTFEQNNFPVRFTEGTRTGATAVFPSQNLVDAFETAGGYKVTLTGSGWECDDPAFNPSAPYEGRDPRFYRTVLADGMEFKGSVIEAFEGGLDDAEVTAGGSPTGYFLRRYIQETTSFNPNSLVTNKHHWIVYRYAETLLSYAESMANAFPSDMNHTDSEYPYSALWALNQVRSNAGMPLVPSCGYEEFMERLRNEWRVEFAFEDHRFWDVRRWKIGSDTQRELAGVKIRKSASGTLSYYRQVCETRSWSDKMNLYPIPQTELHKNHNLHPQNIGW